MNIIGIIAEYNPFHNGHIYHINKIKELYPNSLIIAIISGNYCERGEISVLNKWDKTEICLENNIDIVVELPFVFATESADTFAKGALKILNELQVNKIVFGSELNDILKLTDIAKKGLKEANIKEYLDKGINYPTALSLATKSNIKTPNDLLAISYIKDIIKNNYHIEAVPIKRTNNYHETTINQNIASATAIRNNLHNKDITKALPINSYNKIYNIDKNKYFILLKYQIISNIDNLNKFHSVDEGIENRIKKYIFQSNSLEELIENIKSKRYTYNRINRMLIHILTSFTKEEKILAKNIEYIKLLGFNKKGKEYLNKIKKELTISLITSYKYNYPALSIEHRVNTIYSIIVNDNSLIKKELQKPIIK